MQATYICHQSLQKQNHDTKNIVFEPWTHWLVQIRKLFEKISPLKIVFNLVTSPCIKKVFSELKLSNC